MINRCVRVATSPGPRIGLTAYTHHYARGKSYTLLLSQELAKVEDTYGPVVIIIWIIRK